MSSSQSELGSVHHIPRVDVVVETEDPVLHKEAERIRTMCNNGDETCGVVMFFTDQGIELRTQKERHHKGYKVDFSTIDRRTGAGNLSKRQPFARAMGDAKSIVDATAGFGSDAGRLAFMGFQVTAIERSPIVAAMVRDGLRRARLNSALKEAMSGHLTLHENEAASAMLTLPSPDVIYLDPMFPPKRKKSALPPGPIQLLQKIVGFNDVHETQALFQIARCRAKQRVVVKRPNSTEYFDEDPQVVYKGKLVRYEVYQPDT